MAGNCVRAWRRRVVPLVLGSDGWYWATNRLQHITSFWTAGCAVEAEMNHLVGSISGNLFGSLKTFLPKSWPCPVAGGWICLICVGVGVQLDEPLTCIRAGFWRGSLSWAPLPGVNPSKPAACCTSSFFWMKRNYKNVPRSLPSVLWVLGLWTCARALGWRE